MSELPQQAGPDLHAIFGMDAASTGTHELSGAGLGLEQLPGADVEFETIAGADPYIEVEPAGGREPMLAADGSVSGQGSVTVDRVEEREGGRARRAARALKRASQASPSPRAVALPSAS